jgi:hypothetical protein
LRPGWERGSGPETGGVELGEDVRGAVAEAAGGRDGRQRCVVVRGEQRQRGEGAQDVRHDQETGEEQAVGDAFADEPEVLVVEPVIRRHWPGRTADRR